MKKNQYPIRLIHAPAGTPRVDRVVFMRLAMRHPGWVSAVIAMVVSRVGGAL